MAQKLLYQARGQVAYKEQDYLQAWEWLDQQVTCFIKGKVLDLPIESVVLKADVVQKMKNVPGYQQLKQELQTQIDSLLKQCTEDALKFKLRQIKLKLML